MVRSLLAVAALAMLVNPLSAQGHCCCKQKMGGSSSSDALNQLAMTQLAMTQQLASLFQQNVAAVVQRVSNEDEDSLRKLCRSRLPAERLAATLVIGQRGLPMKKELTALRNDPHPLVRQAAGQSLLLMSQRSRQSNQTTK